MFTPLNCDSCFGHFIRKQESNSILSKIYSNVILTLSIKDGMLNVNQIQWKLNLVKIETPNLEVHVDLNFLEKGSLSNTSKHHARILVSVWYNSLTYIGKPNNTFQDFQYYWDHLILNFHHLNDKALILFFFKVGKKS